MNGGSISRAASGSGLIQGRRKQLPLTCNQSPGTHNLQAAYRWLCKAQDVTGDGGVAAWYHLFRGWASSYPETTGYIIPTFLACATVLAEQEARNRAIKMADFECTFQLPSGAVRAGQVRTRSAPAVFNTGQVLFGWVAAYQATCNQRYADAATRAAEWLIRGQDDDGAWRKDLSSLTTSTVQTYNVRSAWGLALAGQLFGEPRWIKAARENCDWALGQQLDNGWFANDTFRAGENPLLHTIGYTLEGLLGVGESLGEQKYIEAVERGVSPLVRMLIESKALKGRYDTNWRPTVRWRCPTGEAQLAVVLARLHRHVPNQPFAEVIPEILNQLSSIQGTAGSRPEIRGAIPGSRPCWGLYCPFKYVNWAVKFYIDALLLHLFQADVQNPTTQVSARERMK